MGTKQLNELDDEFRTLTGEVKASAEQLVLIEDAKSRLPVEDPRRLSLSQRAQDVAADILLKTAAETALVKNGPSTRRNSAPDRGDR